MTHEGDDVEIVFTFETADAALPAELERVVASEDITVASQMTGGFSVSAFIRPAVDVLAAVLGFVTANRSRLKGARIVIRGHEISLESYSAGEAKRLLESEGFQKALRELTGKAGSPP